MTEEFNAFLMPSSFLRHWSYNELIPALLYFDRVTFLMDDIEARYISDRPADQVPGEPPVRLRGPTELMGMAPHEFVDGLTVEQHRYYWPLRDLLHEEVIVISSMDIGGIVWPDDRHELQSLVDRGTPRAHEYVRAASEYYDAMAGAPSGLSPLDKALRVRSWIREGLMFRRPGWQQVTLHPAGYVALIAALGLFADLGQRHTLEEEITQQRARSYTPIRVVGTLLAEELHSFAIGDDHDALSELLEVRHKYADDLRAFREMMATATREWDRTSAELASVPKAAEQYARELRPVFVETRRALGDRWRTPKLVLRKAGTLMLSGSVVAMGVAVGTLLAGPLGALIGAAAAGTVTASITEGLKTVFDQAGGELVTLAERRGIETNGSLAYLFHAQEALR